MAPEAGASQVLRQDIVNHISSPPEPPTLSKSVHPAYIGGAGRKIGYGDKRLSE